MSVTGDAIGTAIANAMFAPVAPPPDQLAAWKKTANAIVASFKTLNPTEGVLMAANADGFPVPGSGGGGANTVWASDGPPDADLGELSDFAIDYTNWDIYGPKTAGGWGDATSMIGPQGDPGVDGESFNAMGDWSALTSYSPYDFVRHNGVSYFSITANLGAEPPNPVHWQVVAEDGIPQDIADQIHAATSLTPPADTDEIPAVREILGVWTLIKFTWANIKAQFAAAVHTHAHNDTTSLNTGDYQHLTAAELAKLQGFPNKITVSATEPTSPTTGDIWVDISGFASVLKAWNGAAWI